MSNRQTSRVEEIRIRFSKIHHEQDASPRKLHILSPNIARLLWKSMGFVVMPRHFYTEPGSIFWQFEGVCFNASVAGGAGCLSSTAGDGCKRSASFVGLLA